MVHRTGEDDLPGPMRRHVIPTISPAQLSTMVDGLKITVHDKATGSDGTLGFDATVQYRLGGIDTVVLVQAKLHTKPINRDLVQILHEKVQSVGAQKGVLVSTVPFQKGAIRYAVAHEIALVTITDGRFTDEVRSIDDGRLTARFSPGVGIPAFIAYAFSPGADWWGPGRPDRPGRGFERIDPRPTVVGYQGQPRRIHLAAFDAEVETHRAHLDEKAPIRTCQNREVGEERVKPTHLEAPCHSPPAIPSTPC